MSPVEPFQVVDAGERVHAPLTLSDTVTWPAESYSPNQPTRRSPCPTAPNEIVRLATREPVVTALPCTNLIWAGTCTGTAADALEWLPAASNASTE